MEIIIGKHSADEQPGFSVGQRLRVTAIGQTNSFEFSGVVVSIVNNRYAYDVELDNLHAVDELPDDEDVRVMQVLAAEASWTVLCPGCQTEQPIPVHDGNPNDPFSFGCWSGDCNTTLIVRGAVLSVWAKRDVVRVINRLC